MGSVLGPTFAEFYMSHLENNIFAESPKPRLYVRYVDDILILTINVDEVTQLRSKFEANSVLNFTIELNKNNIIPFLDVLVDNSSEKFITSTYKKPTSVNSPLLNYHSECPHRYKVAVIKSLINRAKNISSSYIIFMKELRNIKQVLINNEFPNYIVDTQIKIALANLNTKPQDADKKNLIPLYYCNQFHPNYKQDETAIKNILKQNATPASDNGKLNLIIYYRKFKTENILIRNSPRRSRNTSKTNVIYTFTCPIGSCALDTTQYIGKTQMSLSRRLSYHISSSSSSIKQHINSHGTLTTPIREILTGHTNNVASDRCPIRLAITEALYIKEKKPCLNKIAFELSQNVLRLFN